MKKKYLLYVPLLSLFFACGDDAPGSETPGTDQGTVVSVEKVVRIDAGQTFQTITGFGASDCWSPAYVGKYWTASRDKISELLDRKSVV